MNKNYVYFKYILEHKHNVFIECIEMSKEYKGKNKLELIIHAFTHDLSKFSIVEFSPYANYDFQNSKNNTDKIKTNFKKAWQHHKDKNKHHWNYWDERNLRMPVKYIRFMVTDWSAMSKKFGDTPQQFYLNNYKNIKLHRESRHLVEIFLGLAYEGLDDFMNISTIEEIITESLQYEKRSPNSFDYEWFFGEYLEGFKVKYNINMLEVLGLENDRGDIHS